MVVLGPEQKILRPFGGFYIISNVFTANNGFWFQFIKLSDLATLLHII